MPRLTSAEPDLSGLENMAQFAMRFPLCVAPATYCRAMQLINQKGDYQGAAQHFRAAYQLCRKKLELNPSGSVVEEDLVYQALFHEALALSYAKRPGDASKVLDEVFAPDQTPAVPVSILERAKSVRLGLAA